jgi:hypothetical protein
MSVETQSEAGRYVGTWMLAHMLDMSERTVWRRIKAGVLPKPEPRRKPARFDVEGLIRHAERVDPFLSVRLAGEVARLRAHIEQSRRLRWLQSSTETEIRVAG